MWRGETKNAIESQYSPVDELVQNSWMQEMKYALNLNVTVDECSIREASCSVMPKQFNYVTRI